MAVSAPLKLLQEWRDLHAATSELERRYAMASLCYFQGTGPAPSLRDRDALHAARREQARKLQAALDAIEQSVAAVSTR